MPRRVEFLLLALLALQCWSADASAGVSVMSEAQLWSVVADPAVQIIFVEADISLTNGSIIPGELSKTNLSNACVLGPHFN